MDNGTALYLIRAIELLTKEIAELNENFANLSKPCKCQEKE